MNLRYIEKYLPFGLAFVWLLSGMLHSGNLPRFALDICRYDVVPCWTAAYLSPLLCSIHLVLGAYLLSGYYQQPCMLISGLLLSGYTLAMVTALTQGLNISCGCLGTLSPSISWSHVVFNAALIAVIFVWWLLCRNGVKDVALSKV